MENMVAKEINLSLRPVQIFEKGLGFSHGTKISDLETERNGSRIMKPIYKKISKFDPRITVVSV